MRVRCEEAANTEEGKEGGAKGGRPERERTCRREEEGCAHELHDEQRMEEEEDVGAQERTRC